MNPSEHPRYHDLTVARSILERVRGFPHGICHPTAKAIDDFLGFPIVKGTYLKPNEKGFLLSNHAWNYDPDLRVYIDLTQDQFGLGAGPIEILPEDTPILYKSDTATERIRESPLDAILCLMMCTSRKDSAIDFLKTAKPVLEETFRPN